MEHSLNVKKTAKIKQIHSYTAYIILDCKYRCNTVLQIKFIYSIANYFRIHSIEYCHNYTTLWALHPFLGTM